VARSGVIPCFRGAFDIDSSTQCAKIGRRNSLHHWKQKMILNMDRRQRSSAIHRG
jgi:hypothetical protein